MAVTMVLPTFNRLAALQDTLPFLLAVRGVDEIIAIDDASTDGSADWLEALDEPRLRVVRHAERRGQPAVRNRGLEEARGDWVVFGEDDCRFPPDYVEALLAAAEEHGADVVGAPWLFTPDVPVQEAVAAAAGEAVDRIELDQVMRFPARPLRTPFLPALALVHRRVFAQVRYDESYRGNAYREETDFFVAAMRAGFTCLLTPATYAWQVQRWPGGAHVARWRYELSSLRNNGRFLRKHGAWLRAQGLTGAPALVWLRFAGERARYLAEFYGRRAAGRTLRAVGLKS